MSFTGAEYWNFLAEHRLMGSRCASCGALHLPPHPICNGCHGTDMEWVEFSGQGRLAAFTVIHIAPSAMIQAGYGRHKPYCAGIVQLNEGPSISAQVLGVDATRPEEILIGTPLEAVYIERQEGHETHTHLAFTRVVQA